MVVVVHLAYVLFVVLGFLGVLVGAPLGWKWPRNRTLRLAHLAAMTFVGFEAMVGMVCPLTQWEFDLRQAAGVGGDHGAFIARWAQQLLYYDFPPWVFVTTYLFLTGLVFTLWWLIPPRPKKS